MDVQRIARLVAKNVLGQESADLLDVATFRNPSSLVHRLEFSIGDAPTTLFVKLPSASGPKFRHLEQRLRREFEVTKSVSAAFPESPELRTVSPAGFLDEVNGLVTWGIHGTSLLDMIQDKLRFRFDRTNPRLAMLCSLAGRWLRQFHSLDLIENEPDLRRLLTNYCADRLDALARIETSQIPVHLAKSLKLKVSTWVDEALAAPGTKIVLCHNDYSPHNIIANEGHICVLDYSFAGPGLPAFDVACFWHKLEDLKSSPLHSSSAVGALQNKFLTGYGETFALNRPEAKLGLARLVLSKMLTMVKDQPARSADWLVRRRRYAGYLALLNSEFESSGGKLPARKMSVTSK